MNVYIANFGSKNWAWPECLRRGAIAMMDDTRVHPFWQRGDKDGYIETAMRVLRTKKGQPPTKQLASRWYNVNTILHETSGDIWIHREKDELWWTTSTSAKPESYIRDDPEPNTEGARIYVYYKPCNAWSHRDKKGKLLLWSEIHPRARQFLFTEQTFQRPEKNNALYAKALIEGAELGKWYILPKWQEVAKNARGWAEERRSPEEIAEQDRKHQTAERMAQTAARMIKTAQQTALQSCQEVISVTKDKRFLFPTDAAAQEYALDLMKKQEGRCALTGLKMLLDGEPGDDQCRYSLDRIDSSKHYEPGNLQVVCKFANKWKGAMANEEFRRLVSLVRSSVADPV